MEGFRYFNSCSAWNLCYFKIECYVCIPGNSENVSLAFQDFPQQAHDMSSPEIPWSLWEVFTTYPLSHSFSATIWIILFNCGTCCASSRLKAIDLHMMMLDIYLCPLSQALWRVLLNSENIIPIFLSRKMLGRSSSVIPNSNQGYLFGKVKKIYYREPSYSEDSRKLERHQAQYEVRVTLPWSDKQEHEVKELLNSDGNYVQRYSK